MNTHSLEQHISDIIESTANALGLTVVKVNIFGKDVQTVEILIERLDNMLVSINDCTVLSNNISTLLDVENVIENKYFLHVSSAGLERPLVKVQDYDRFIGREVKIKLKDKIENSLNFKGKIIGTSNNDIVLESNNKNILIPFNAIKNAHLVLTDEIFKKLLK